MSTYNGLKIRSNLGNSVKDASSAINIANAVSIPKWMVGTKFDSVNIENPAMIVMAVYEIALPILAWQLRSVIT